MADITLNSLTNNPEIPSLPDVVVKLLQLISDDAPIPEIKKVISHDIGLTARTLQIANSAWYKRQNQVAEVAEAISVIGVNALQQLILATSVARIFNEIEIRIVDMLSFWKQSVRMAAAAQVLASQYEKGQPIEHFTRGMVAYIGKLALYIVEPATAQRILTHSRCSAIPQYLAENEILGFNHAQIASALLTKWQLPKEFITPIEFYPQPEEAPAEYQQAAAILNIAHYTQYTYARIDVGLTDPLGDINQYALDLVEIEAAGIPEVANASNAMVDDVVLMFGLT